MQEVVTNVQQPIDVNISPELESGQTYQGRATFYDAANPAGGKGNSGYDVLSGDALAGITAINNVQWNASESSGAFWRCLAPSKEMALHRL
ncbi:MAG: hypothetical protein HC764_15765 [Pleurocapsa sp. CRU_1_2]|nr:hypothetical protein [Pleurocapsa sp. CRU_1_2]